MRKLPCRIVTVLALACAMAGCANLGRECACATGAKAVTDSKKASGLSQQRVILSEGYSMLHSDAGQLGLTDLILYVKVESEPVHKIVTDVADFGDQLKKELERMAKDYPGVRIDLDPLPEMEKRKRMAIAKDRAAYFAPLVGHGGREYERTVLIAYANGINHERHLCEVMAEEEPDPNLKKFLLATEKRYDGFYDRVSALLDKEYFKDPNGKSKD